MRAEYQTTGISDMHMVQSKKHKKHDRIEEQQGPYTQYLVGNTLSKN